MCSEAKAAVMFIGDLSIQTPAQSFPAHPMTETQLKEPGDKFHTKHGSAEMLSSS